jgi:site-specific DNA recombinase
MVKILSALKPRKVGIWIRVSTEFQVNSDSPLHHEARAKEYASSKNWDIKQIYRLDAISGKSVINHPETQRMLQDIRSGTISCLIVSKFARLVRKTRELLEISDIFQQHHADLVSLDEPINISTSSGRLFLGIIASLAEWEREEISTRVSASVPIRCKLGKSVGGAAPFGYQWIDNNLAVNPQEAPIRELIYKLYIEHKRKKTVAKLLNKAGHTTRNGGKFSDTTIDRLIRDPTAKGIRRANYTKSTGDKKHWIMKPESEWVTIPVNSIISEELWNEANRLLNNRCAKLSRKPGKKHPTLFAGIIQCECGNKMYRPSNNHKYVCKKCRRKIEVTIVEKYFISSLNAIIDPKQINAIVARIQNELLVKKLTKKELDEKATLLKEEMNKCYNAYIENKMELDDFGSHHQIAKNKLRAVEAELAEIESDIAAHKKIATSAQTKEAILKISHWWEKSSFENRRQLVETIVKQVVATKSSCSFVFHYICSFPQKCEIDFLPLVLLCGLEIEIFYDKSLPEITQFKSTDIDVCQYATA